MLLPAYYHQKTSVEAGEYHSLQDVQDARRRGRGGRSESSSLLLPFLNQKDMASDSRHEEGNSLMTQQLPMAVQRERPGPWRQRAGVGIRGREVGVP